MYSTCITVSKTQGDSGVAFVRNFQIRAAITMVLWNKDLNWMVLSSIEVAAPARSNTTIFINGQCLLLHLPIDVLLWSGLEGENYKFFQKYKTQFTTEVGFILWERKLLLITLASSPGHLHVKSYQLSLKYFKIEKGICRPHWYIRLSGTFTLMQQ